MLQAEQLTKWQLFSLKMTTSTILSEIAVICSGCNNIYFLLSFKKNHVIHEPTEINYNKCKAPEAHLFKVFEISISNFLFYAESIGKTMMLLSCNNFNFETAWCCLLLSDFQITKVKRYVVMASNRTGHKNWSQNICDLIRISRCLFFLFFFQYIATLT